MQEHTQQHSTQQAIIRTLRRDDHADMIDLVRQIWYPQCSQRCGRLAATVDWETALSDATIAKVAEEEGHPIAVILGRVDRHDSRAAWNIHRRRALKALAALAFSGEGRRILADLLGIAAVDNRMFRRRRHDYPAEVTLFLVSPSARGMGLGKRLFNTNIFSTLTPVATWDSMSILGCRRLMSSSSPRWSRPRPLMSFISTKARRDVSDWIKHRTTITNIQRIGSAIPV